MFFLKQKLPLFLCLALVTLLFFVIAFNLCFEVECRKCLSFVSFHCGPSVHFLYKITTECLQAPRPFLAGIRRFLLSAFEFTCIPKLKTLRYTFINSIGHFYSLVWKQAKRYGSVKTCLQKVPVSSLSWHEGCLD